MNRICKATCRHNKQGICQAPVCDKISEIQDTLQIGNMINFEYTDNYIRQLQQKYDKQVDNWNKLKEWLNDFHKLSEFQQWEIVKKMQELEQGSDGNE